MVTFVTIAGFLIFAFISLSLLIRRNLKQRASARRYRDLFISTANDLVGKPEFPENHARQLVQMASLPQGWLTRFIVMRMAKAMFFGEGNRAKKTDLPKFEQVPAHLQAPYVLAIFTFLLSDTYRCAIFGRVVRGTHLWLFDAIKEVKPDVNAHATREIVEQVTQVNAPRRVTQEYELACVG